MGIDNVSISAPSSATAPTVTTNSTVTSISTTGATLGGNITNINGANATVRGFEYSTSSGFANGTGTNSTDSGDYGNGTFTKAISGLTANTLYYFKAKAQNSAGTGWGAQASFTTLPLPPTVGTGSSATSSGFTANWSLPTMGSATHNFTVEVSTNNSTFASPTTVTGILSGNTSQAITGLSPSTTYYYRIKSVNAQGDSAWSSGSAGIATSAAAGPVLTAATLASALTATYPSASSGVSFTAAGTNLTENILVTAQSGYEVSTSSGSGYGASVSVATGTTVWVRFAASRAAGNYNSATAAVLSSAGAANANVTTSSSGNTISKGTPSITAAPTASTITYGQTLASSELTGGTASVAGSFAFTTPATAPAAGTASQGVTFTPTDGTNYNTASTTASVTVNKATPTLVFNSANSTTIDGTVTLNATSASTGAVTYTSSNNAVVSIASDVATGVAIGTATITASQAADSNYNAATANQTMTVTAAPVVLAGWDFAGLSAYGSSPQTANTTASGVTIGGLTRNGFTTSGTAASNAWGGVGNGNATFTVKANAGYTINLSQIPTYNVRRSSAGATTGQWAYSTDGTNFTNIGSAITWGSVTTSAGNTQSAINLSDILPLQNLDSSTTVTFRISNTGATTGTWYLNNSTASDDFTVTGLVTQLPPTVTAATINGTVGTPLSANITATNSPTGYAISSGTLPAGLSLNATTGEISGTPTEAVSSSVVAVTATNGGGTSAAANLTFNIAQGSQSITFGALSSKTYGDSTFSLTATASSGLSVSYASSNTSVATVAGSTVTVVGVGSTTITANQSGNANFSAAANVNQSLTVNPKALTGSFTANNKTFDGTTSAAVATRAVSGKVGSDDVNHTGGTATFADANVGNGKTVTLTGASLTGADAAKYTLGSVSTTTANITAASQTLTRATFTATHTRVMGGNYAVSVTASPAGGTVVYASSNSSVATVAGGTITVVGAGNATITASQSDGNYTATPLTQSLTILPTTWTLIENFNGLGTGGINGTGGWTANTTNASVAVDPAEASNQCLQVAGNHTYAFKSLATTGNQTATLFLRFRIGHIDTVGNSSAGETSAFMGVSHVPTPTAFGNFTAQWGTNPTFGTTSVVGDPGAPFHLASINSSTSYHNNSGSNRFPAQQPGGGQWYHAWAVINSTTGNYSLHLGGGAFGNRTMLTEWNITGNSTAGAAAFPFRTSGTNNGTISETEALKVFLRSGASNNSTLHVDDIYFASGENLTLPFPELSRATSPAVDGFTVNWSAVNNAVNYTVLHSASKNMSDAVSATTASTSLALSSLSPGLRYVQVRANFANGTNATSAQQVNQLRSLAAGTTTYASVPGVLRSVGNATLASFLLKGNSTVTFTPYPANSTISEIFGSSNEAGLAQGSTDSVATTILLPNSNGSTANTIFYDTDVNEWREGPTDMGSTAIAAGKAFMLKNNTGSTDYFLLVGTPRDSQPVVSLSSAGNFTLLTTGRTTETPLTSLNLNPGTGAGQFKAASKPSGGDRLIVPPANSTDPVTTYWYHTTSGQWYDGLTPVPSAGIPAGQGFFIKRASDSTFSTWTMPAE